MARAPRRRAAVIQSEDGVSVQSHHEMVDPRLVFRADFLEVVDCPGGKRMVAIRVRPFDPTVAVEAVEFVFDTHSWNRWQAALESVVPTLRQNAEGVGVQGGIRFEGELASIEPDLSYQSFLAYLATANHGASLDLYGYPAIELHRIGLGVEPAVDLVPQVRIETLPGRLLHLVARVDEAEESADGGE